MPNPSARRLAAVSELDRPALHNLWKELFGSSPPPQLRRDLMFPILAHRLQEQAFGSLSTATRSRLRQLSQAFARNSNLPVPAVPRIRPGTRLVREWGDQVHLVNVQNSGYEYRGARYKSLSQIARLITGTRWSGPLFFGVNGNQSENKTKEAQ